MKEVIATEEVLNEFGDIIAVRYWYRDGTYTEKKVFIPPKKTTKNTPKNTNS